MSTARREGEYGWGLSINAPASAPVLHLLQVRGRGKGGVVVVVAVALVEEVRQFLQGDHARGPMINTIQSALHTLRSKSPFWIREVQRKGTVFWMSTPPPPPSNHEAHMLPPAPPQYERSPQAYTPTTIRLPNVAIMMDTTTTENKNTIGNYNNGPLHTFLNSRLPPLPTATGLGGRWVHVGVSPLNTHPATSIPAATRLSFYTGWLVDGDANLMCLCCRKRAVWTHPPEGGGSCMVGENILIPRNPALLLPNSLFCSGWCRSEFAVRGGVSGRLRQAVSSLDGGVCSQCGLDGTALLIELQAISAHSNPTKRANLLREAILRQAPHFGDHPTILSRLATSQTPPTAGQLWHADHVVPVHLGGGGCALDNIQTLCVAGHADKTSIECATLGTQHDT